MYSLAVLAIFGLIGIAASVGAFGPKVQRFRGIFPALLLICLGLFLVAWLSGIAIAKRAAGW